MKKIILFLTFGFLLAMTSCVVKSSNVDANVESTADSTFIETDSIAIETAETDTVAENAIIEEADTVVLTEE